MFNKALNVIHWLFECFCFLMFMAAICALAYEGIKMIVETIGAR